MTRALTFVLPILAWSCVSVRPQDTPMSEDADQSVCDCTEDPDVDGDAPDVSWRPGEADAEATIHGSDRQLDGQRVEQDQGHHDSRMGGPTDGDPDGDEGDATRNRDAGHDVGGAPNLRDALSTAVDAADEPEDLTPGSNQDSAATDTLIEDAPAGPVPCQPKEDCPAPAKCYWIQAFGYVCEDVPLLAKCVDDSNCGAGVCVTAPGGPTGTVTNWSLWPSELLDIGECDYKVCWVTGNNCSGSSWCGCACAEQTECVTTGSKHLIMSSACTAQPGTRHVGWPCAITSDCVTGLVCRKKSFPNSVGVCLPPSGLGEPCSTHADCIVGLACAAEACEVPVPIGAPCAASEHCGPGAACHAMTGVCLPSAGALGDPCSTKADCDQFRHKCVDGICTADMGKKCHSTDECAGGAVCVLVDGGVFGDCVYMDYAWGKPVANPPAVCDPYYTTYSCDYSNTYICGRCLPDSNAVPVGGQCWRHVECMNDGVCIAGTCVLPEPVGGPCTENMACEPGLWCDPWAGPACAEPGTAGRACTSDASCEPGLVCGTLTEPYECIAPASTGLPCALDKECQKPLKCYQIQPEPDPKTCGMIGKIGSPCGEQSACDTWDMLGCWKGVCTSCSDM